MRSQRPAAIVLMGLAAAMVTGCKPRPTAEPALAAGAIDLQTVDENQLAAEVARQRGKVVLVDYWATWCEPCKQLFPHNVELHRRLADQGLVVISVSVDDPADSPAVLAFLKSQAAVFPNFISLYGTSEQTIRRFEIPSGVVPHLKLYDRKGRLYATFGVDGKPLTPETIEQAVSELLNGYSDLRDPDASSNVCAPLSHDRTEGG